MIEINNNLKIEDFKSKIRLLWSLSGEKIERIISEYDESKGALFLPSMENTPHVDGLSGPMGFNLVRLFYIMMQPVSLVFRSS